MQRFVKTLRLVDTPEAIAAYREAHDNIWPGIAEGIRSVGIRLMDLYLDGNLAVMIMEADDTLDVEEAMARLAALPGQEEWERHVAAWQQCDPADTSAGKWRPMEKIFTLP